MKSITAKRAPAASRSQAAGQGRPVGRNGVAPGAPVRRRWAGRTWCAAPRNPLFLRRRAPRLPGPRRRRQAGRGAPLPAIPYSFVAKHHVFRVQGAGGGPDVVCRSPQSLILSSPSTTSSGSKAPAAGRTWCAAPRNPLFFRRRAPRLSDPRRQRRSGRSAPLPAIPYSFVAEQHVFRVQGAGGGADVVRHSPQSLIPSAPSTTSSGAKAPAAGRRLDMKTTCTGSPDGGPVQVVLFIITIPTQRHRCTAGSRCPSGR